MFASMGRMGRPKWFEDVFGFPELSYEATRAKFRLEDGGKRLVVRETGKRFEVGAFECLTSKQLRDRWAAKPAGAHLGPLRFSHVIGDVKSLHLDPNNADAVFQAASQFNALEMVGPDWRPEDGITRYSMDPTQGPACATSCPAGTVYRNYFCMPGGLGQVQFRVTRVKIMEDRQDTMGGGQELQLNLLKQVEDLLDNSSNHYWTISNGYCFPTDLDSLPALNRKLEQEQVGEDVRDRVAVAVHWSTEVDGRQHKVCQVYTSALPMAYFPGPSQEDWQPFASAVLDGLYDATLAVAAVTASQRGARVQLFLTAVGGGVFGNPTAWIAAAIQRALDRYASAPLDVKLVHYGSLPSGGPFMALGTNQAL